MEPPQGFWETLWSFLRFLPFFLGLLLLGIIKGALLFPFVCLITTIGNTAIILGLWPAHAVWTYYCIARAKKLGPVLKLVLIIFVSLGLVFWPLVGIVGSVIFGAGYGFLMPVMATFDAVGEGKTNVFIHCFADGTWSTIKGSFTIVRDLKDVCFHSYFSIMDDLRMQNPPNGQPYEIRLLHIPSAFIVGILGIIVDMPIITLVALVKSPYMLFKGWKRLVQDLIGREGPFLETACVPFAGLTIILWPLAVVGAVQASMLSSLFLGAYAAVITYQESSIKMGLAYIITSLNMFDEYSNDVLDMPEGSCFPRRKYRKKEIVHSSSITRPTSFRSENLSIKNPPSRATSFKNVINELNPLKLLEQLFSECKRYGEKLVAEGIITQEDIKESRSGKDNKILSIGLPAYSILQALLVSAKTDCDGLLLSDNTEITSDNKPKDIIFNWFFDPLMIIKQQIRAQSFSEEEEDYLSKLVLLLSDSERLKSLNIQPPKCERKKAEINALARRLQGITKSISRYPTARRRFDDLVKSLSEELEKLGGGSQSLRGSQSLKQHSVRSMARILSQKLYGRSESKEISDPDIESSNNVTI